MTNISPSPPYQHPGLDDTADQPRLWWRNFRKSLGLPASSDVGALSTIIKALKTKTEETLGHEVHEAAASVPYLPAIYDEDLYEAFEYVGMDYLQIKWRPGGPGYKFLTYDTPAALAGHNFSLCWDYSREHACYDDDLPENTDVYLLVTYSQSDLMVTMGTAQGRDLYDTHDTTALRLDLGSGSSLRTSNEKEYWNQVRDAVVNSIDDKYRHHHWYVPARLIFVGESISDEQFVGFVEAKVHDYLRERNEKLPKTIKNDPMFVQAKGVAELARRRPHLPTPERPCGFNCPAAKARVSGEGLEL